MQNTRCRHESFGSPKACLRLGQAWVRHELLLNYAQRRSPFSSLVPTSSPRGCCPLEQEPMMTQVKPLGGVQPFNTTVHAGAEHNPTEGFHGCQWQMEGKACHLGQCDGRGDPEGGCAGRSCPNPRGWLETPCCWWRVLKKLLPAPVLLPEMMKKTKGLALDQPVGQVTPLPSSCWLMQCCEHGQSWCLVVRASKFMLCRTLWALVITIANFLHGTPYMHDSHRHSMLVK